VEKVSLGFFCGWWGLGLLETRLGKNRVSAVPLGFKKPGWQKTRFLVGPKKPGWQKSRFLVGPGVVRNPVGKKPGFWWGLGL